MCQMSEPLYAIRCAYTGDVIQTHDADGRVRFETFSTFAAAWLRRRDLFAFAPADMTDDFATIGELAPEEVRKVASLQLVHDRYLAQTGHSVKDEVWRIVAAHSPVEVPTARADREWQALSGTPLGDGQWHCVMSEPDARSEPEMGERPEIAEAWGMVRQGNALSRAAWLLFALSLVILLAVWRLP